MSPPEWLASFGALGPRTLLPDRTYVCGYSRIGRPGRDPEIIRDSAAAIVHCPLVSGRHGNLIESFARRCRMGLAVGIGTDTWPPDMVLNMQRGMILCRVTDGDGPACRSEDYYDASTIGGANALGQSDLGRLAPGAMADIIVFDLTGPHFGQVIDPIQTIMLSGPGTHMHTVIVRGRASMQGCAIPGVDWASFARQAGAQFAGLMAQYPRRTFGHPPPEEIFSPAYPVVRRA